jgi:hypothetical protein
MRVLQNGAWKGSYGDKGARQKEHSEYGNGNHGGAVTKRLLRNFSSQIGDPGVCPVFKLCRKMKELRNR